MSFEREVLPSAGAPPVDWWALGLELSSLIFFFFFCFAHEIDDFNDCGETGVPEIGEMRENQPVAPVVFRSQWQSMKLRRLMVCSTHPAMSLDQSLFG